MTPKEKEQYQYLSDRDYEDYYVLLELWERDVKGYQPKSAAPVEKKRSAKLKEKTMSLRYTRPRNLTKN